MKRRSKIMAAMLAVLLIVCMLPTAAFAAETPSGSVAIGSFTSGTVTINASNADDSFALYKVIAITYDSAKNEVAYDFTAAAKAYNATLGAAAPSIKVYQGWADDSVELKNYLGGFASYVKAKSVTADKTGTAEGGVCTITAVALGQYLVLGTGSSTGAYVYQLMTATFKPDGNLNVNTGVTLSSKASQPTITKTAADTQVATGDTVTYTLEITIPTYPARATNRAFSVSDTLPTELTFVNTVSVKVDAADLGAAYFKFTQDGQKLTWNIENFDGIQAGTKLVIVYTATVAEHIPVTTGATNTAALTYSNNPYGAGTHTLTAAETVYSYEIQLTKKEKGAETLLSGVEFELYKGSVAEGNKIGTTYVTDEHGIITVKGLDVGTYFLKETKTATGYVLPTEPVEVTITDADKDGLVDKGSEEQTTGIVSITVENTKGEYQLPQTGGVGTWVFTIVGVCLMAGAVAFLLVYRKKSAKSN